jgi:hypothetical protein
VKWRKSRANSPSFGSTWFKSSPTSSDSLAMSDLEQPDSTAQPTFKRKKRPQQSRTISLREGSASGSEATTPREGTPGSGFDDEEGGGARCVALSFLRSV